MAAADTKSTIPHLTLEDECFVVKGSDVIDVFGLECEVCKELFDLDIRPPKLLPCKHTLCGSCLERLRAEKPADVNVLACPHCQTDFISGSVYFPNDHRVVKGLDIVKKSKATFKDLCLKHDCKKLDKFCETCDVLVCSDCIRFLHEKNDDDDAHTIVDVTKSLDSMSVQFDDLERRCTTSLRQKRMKQDVISNVKHHLGVNEKDQISRIREQFDYYTKILSERKEVLITMVQEKTRKLLSQISLEVQQLEDSTNELQKLYDQFTASRKTEEVRELFKTRKRLISDKRDLLNVASTEGLCATFEFRSANGKLLEADIAAIGELHEKFDLKLQCPVPGGSGNTCQGVFRFSAN